MNVLIVEDEGIAADRLVQLLGELDSNIQIVQHLDSVKSTVQWFENHAAPDLAFFDIQLADGLSFEIFDQADVKCPIIFTTAYDQYAIQAFKVNSVDYLLKPMVKEDLQQALDKFKNQSQKESSLDTKALINMLQQQNVSYKERFVIKVGEHLKSVMTTNVELFLSQDKATYILANDGKKFIIDFTLDQVESSIDPKIFFRVNRKHIVHIDSIKDIITYSNSRLKLELNHFNADDLIVSRERVTLFKEWLDR
ncbi:MAG: LytTR family DNA-binding domain-containing protein [Reichenbachiella sp.]|uniref:LytR/AlgR family response regulator transcription factor n=1 Tax=Reichenbachiella sp. TaxID=2184521 RepID=UPI00326596C2